MKHLSAGQTAELRSELEHALSKLQKSLVVSDQAVRPVELDQTAVGRLSRMDSLQSQSMAKGLRERETVRLALVRDALKRIDDGTYGLCAACGGEIAFERLMVFPESPTCAGCSG
ncbi:MAG: TraR/DksA family transcriptional regulator [Gemmatimonadetes bacterium]|nr:TraR/DksA C4-type zinc finger protein [Gemmatimonadota bacterium]NNM05374.1 TraR/DksA family transcriptional regulator [Gemmatimonadota bacterium]